MISTAQKLSANIKDIKTYKAGVLKLEAGGTLQDVSIGYNTFGNLNAAKDNVIWVCHALTASSDVSDWWAGIFGEGKILDPTKYFIVCANILGSPYGSTNARSTNPLSGLPYGLDLPLVTIRDQVNLHARLARHLVIEKIAYAIGGSCGGHQVLEMCLHADLNIDKAIMLVTSAAETPWSISIHEAQRMALKADDSFYDNTD